MKSIVIVDGVRTPYVKSGTAFSTVSASDLGVAATKELLAKTNIDPSSVQEVIFGNIGQPADTANIARIIALRSGIPIRVPAYTVQRNCASGMEAISSAYEKIHLGVADIVIAGGVESMTQIPLLFPLEFSLFMDKWSRARSWGNKIKLLRQFKPRYLKPIVALLQGLTDPTCGLNMGQATEILAREYKISRDEQDKFALESHQKAVAAMEAKKFADEIVPVYVPPHYDKYVDRDSGPRKDQSLEKLKKLSPVFDRRYGTITAGNSCPITDGGVALLVMTEEKAKELGYTPLGRIRSYAYAGCEPRRMGLGPAYATPVALKRGGLTLRDIQLIEINEAFAAQVLACARAFESADFAKQLGLIGPIGEIRREILNVNGGAIALGHPVGSSGARLVLTILKEMNRRQANFGLATLCIGGGQGGAMVLERST